MSSRKPVLLTLVIASLLLSLVATQCAPATKAPPAEKPTEPATKAPPAEKPTEPATEVPPAEKPFAGTKLVAWNTVDPEFLWADEAPAMLKEFEEETGITVEWGNFGPEWRDKVAAALATGSSDVDVVFTWAAPTAEWASAGWLEDVGDRYTPEMKEDLLEQPMQSVVYQGVIYGVPQFLSAQTGYYNTKLFEEAGLDPENPPETFEEFIEAAEKLTKDLDGDGTPDQYGFSVSWGEHGNLFLGFAQWTQLAGGDVLDENGKPVFNSPEGAKALQAMADGVRDGWIDPGSASYPDTFLALQPFLAGKIGIEFHWPAVWARVNDPEESQVVDQIKMFLVPGWSDGRRSAAVDGSMGWNLSKFSKNKDAAWEFMKWACSPHAQKVQVLKTGWLPVRASVFDDPEVSKASPLVPHYKEQVKYPGKRYGTPYYQELATAIYPHLIAAINGEVSVEEGLAAAEEAASEVVAKY